MPSSLYQICLLIVLVINELYKFFKHEFEFLRYKCSSIYNFSGASRSIVYVLAFTFVLPITSSTPIFPLSTFIV